MKIRIVGALLIVIFSFSNTTAQETTPSAVKGNTFVMAFNRPENDFLGKWERLIHTEIFKRLSVKIEFRDYPTKRASMEADAGNVDGEAGRIYQYADDHPNLIRVEESFLSVSYAAFTSHDSIPQLNGWNSLKGTTYHVEYQRGIKICELNLPKVVKSENLSDVTTSAQALKKLISGRTDLFVEDELSILALLQTSEFKGSKIRIAGIMESFPIYLYLHKRHADLVPKMAEVIKAMKAEGLIEQYRMAVDREFGVVRK